MERVLMKSEHDNNKRARKRRRRCGAGKTTATEQRRLLPTVADDTNSFRLSDNNYPALDKTAELKVQNALPSLLFQRQYGSMTNAQLRTWQKRVLVTAPPPAEKKDIIDTLKESWRPFAARRVSFLDLGTPYSEALLAIDPSGSYMLTVSDDVNEQQRQQEDENETPTAFLSVRGVPSPARLQTKLSGPPPPSPRLLSIPLDFASQGVKGRFSRRKIVFSLCQDWRMGLVCWPTTSKLRDPAAHITVFPLPRCLRHSDIVIGSYKTTQTVSFPDVVQSMEGYNLLWEVEYVPKRGSFDSKWKFQRQCGCLCTLRLFSELRLTWFTENGAAASPSIGCESPPVSDTERSSHSEDNIFSEVGTSIWSSALSQRLDGSLVDVTNNESTHRIQIAKELCLNIDRLVSGILRRRPKLAKRYDESQGIRLEWKSEVIDVFHEGRVLNLLIAFSPGSAKHPVAVVVSVDLLTQTYKELNWMKSTTVFSHIDMRTLCANFRMKVLRCGPFGPGKSHDDDDDLFVAENGSPGLHYTNRNQEYCFMPLSALYADTQVVSNSNILCAVPRMIMKSRSPVELVYYGDD
eukprot:scaffold34597_cov177-Amphora_coffeaeformis.AAC.26